MLLGGSDSRRHHLEVGITGAAGVLVVIIHKGNIHCWRLRLHYNTCICVFRSVGTAVLFPNSSPEEQRCLSLTTPLTVPLLLHLLG